MIRNVIRAIFWTAVTAAFVPAGFSAAPDGAFARSASELWVAADAQTTSQTLSTQAHDRTNAFCTEQAEACAVGDQLLAFGSVMVNLAGQRAQTWVEDQQTAATPPAPAASADLDAAQSSQLTLILEEMSSAQDAR